jgi:hypothetical protein
MTNKNLSEPTFEEPPPRIKIPMEKCFELDNNKELVEEIHSSILAFGLVQLEIV